MAAIVSLSGRAKAIYDNRSKTRPVRRPRVRHGRGVVRRNDWLSRMILGIGLLGMALAPIGVPPVILTVGFCAPIAVGGYILGIMRKVAVTPVELIVYNAFTITWIPRHLIAGFRAGPDGPVTVRLKGHDPVRIGVGATNPYSQYSGPEQKKAIAKFKALLEDVPEDFNAGEPSVKPRWTTIIALTASVAVWVCAVLQPLQQQ